MHEYYTKPLDRSILLAELAAVRDALSLANIIDVSVSFGWDSNRPIDDMWKDKIVPVKDLLSFIANSEISGAVHVGKADIFIDVPEFVFMLHHESLATVKGRSDLVQKFVRRWEELGYSPKEVRPRV
jgi:hypothetical protein